MKDKVSIIIPAYNVESYIHRAIDSSIKQTYNNIEIIIIDDGSTDKTWDVICSYKKKDERIYAYHQDNMGVSCARNNGLSKVTGDFVVFIDSDDWISENCVSSLLQRVKKYGNDKLISSDCNYAYICDGNIDISSSKKNYDNVDVLMDKYNCLMSFCNSQYRLSSACYKIYNMEIINKYNIRFKEGISHGEDGLFVYNYLKQCNGMFYFTEELWSILDRPGSATSSKYTNKWLSAVQAAEIVYNDNNIKKLRGFFKLYCCSRISVVLCSAIKSDYKSNKDDIRFLKKKLRQYFGGIVKEKRLRRIGLYFILAFFPNSIIRSILP